MHLKNIFFLSIISIAMLGCTSDSTSDLINAEPLPDLVGFNNDIKAIMDNNCTSCHGATPIPGTDLSLDTYEKVKNAVLNRDLIERMMLQEGNSLLMPQGGPKLPQNTIDLVIKWQQDGLQE